MNSAFGANLGFGTGAVHVYFGTRDVFYELMPVDYCVNAILACTYDTYTERFIKKIQLKNIYYFNIFFSKINVNEAIQPVYNCAFGKFIRNTSSDVHRILNSTVEEYPFKQQLWKRSVISTTCPFLFITLTLILHYIPAIFMDAVSVIKRQKPRYTYLDLYVSFGS